MPATILPRHPLLKKQSIHGMRRFRKVPINFQIGTESNDEQPFTHLRHAIVSGVENARDDVVREGSVPCSLKADKVILPCFAALSGDHGVGQLKLDEV